MRTLEIQSSATSTFSMYTRQLNMSTVTQIFFAQTFVSDAACVSNPRTNRNSFANDIVEMLLMNFDSHFELCVPCSPKIEITQIMGGRGGCASSMFNVGRKQCTSAPMLCPTP